uniref:Uncharacterized protein n=1 Tax=Anguilla anguilla TaxID=7936 RepID=A0A0E9W289_ANGAN
MSVFCSLHFFLAKPPSGRASLTAFYCGDRSHCYSSV